MSSIIRVTRDSRGESWKPRKVGGGVERLKKQSRREEHISKLGKKDKKEEIFSGYILAKK